MIVKINLEKAHDRVDWDFLQGILKAMGISEEIIKVITSYISSTNMSVIWNDKCLPEFKPERRLFQSDSLWPFVCSLYEDIRAKYH